MKDFGLVFMGTPEFAVRILQRLHEDHIPIKAVVTAPDKPAGRGQKIHMSAVKEYALAHNLPVLQPVNLKDSDFVESLRALAADLFVVVAFRMLPEVVWSMPAKGTINLHASLLPQYRGAAPINWAVINGEKRSGVTTFFIEKEIDTGKIIERAEVEIGENETAGELYDRLMELGAHVMGSTVEKIQAGQVEGIAQSDFNENELKPAPKIFKEDCKIDFTPDSRSVHNFCRGLSPYPTAWTNLRQKETGEIRSLKVFVTRPTDTVLKGLTAGKDYLALPCGEGALEVIELQLEGKKRMPAKDFLLGFQADKWEVV
jgi:methionyl-tRNA formyltransferase